MIDLSDKTMSSLLMSMLLRITDRVNKREGSLIRTALSAAAWALEGLYIELEYVQKQAYGTSATGDYLDLKVAERGLTRHPATSEVCILKCNLSTLQLGFQFGDSSGYTWNVTSGVLAGPDSNRLYDYNITCQTEGAIAVPEGELRALSFLAGLTVAKFGEIVSPGEDIETDESLRNRYNESLVEIAFAGNVAAYREKLLELEYNIGSTVARIGALQVFAMTNSAGDIEGGNVKIYVVNGDYERASSGLVDAIQDAICPMYNGEVVGLGNGFAPIGAAVHIATVTSSPILTIDIKVILNGTTIDVVSPEIEHNVKTYVQSCIIAWGNQVPTPYDEATITIREAFIYSAALVSGVTDVVSVVLRKNGIEYAGTAVWVTDRTKMEWINLDDVVINITT